MDESSVQAWISSICLLGKENFYSPKLFYLCWMQLVTELGIVSEYRVLHDLGRQVGLSLLPL